MQFSEIIPGPAEREIVFGGTRAGKSSYSDWEMRFVQQTRPECMQLLIDTKPRFRASTERIIYPHWRHDAAGRYSGWVAGPVVPNSVVCDIWSSHPFRGLWDKPGEIVIMQSGEQRDWIRILELVRGFTRSNQGGRERRIIVDEALDFYQRNTMGIHSKNDEFYRTARAGGEHNIGMSIGAHRVHGLPPLIISMCSIITLFHLRHDGDMRYLREYGIPDDTSPTGDYVFRQYRVRPGGLFDTYIDNGIVKYPEAYLNQLAKT